MVRDWFKKTTNREEDSFHHGMASNEIRGVQIWFAFLGLSLSLSLAVSNVLVAIMLLYLFARHPSSLKERLKSKTFIILISAACLFQVMGIIHDGWFITKTAKIYLLFSFMLLIGNVLRSFNIRWLPWFLSSLVIGLAIGTALNLHLRPEYPLWATYAMSYANQAAGFALTIGLLSYATKRQRLFILLLSGSLIYTVMAGERSAFLSLAAAFIVLAAIRYKHSLLLTIPLVMIFLGFFAITLLPDGQIEETKQRYLQDNVRFDIWTHGFLIAQKDYFLGRGEHQAFTAQERSIHTTMGPTARKFFSHTFPTGLSDKAYEEIQLSYHNQAVQYLVEYGLIGFMMFVALLIYPIVLVWRKNNHNRTLATGIMIWSAFAIHSLFETSFDNHSVIIIGLLSGLTQLFTDQSSPGQV
ncbi:O-antigen ligase family protein [Pseudomonadota bacterium]